MTRIALATVALVLFAPAVMHTAAAQQAAPACRPMLVSGEVRIADLMTVTRVLAANPDLACLVDELEFRVADRFQCFGPGHWWGCADLDGQVATVTITTRPDGAVLTPDLVETLCHELTHVWLVRYFGDPGHNDRHNAAIAACMGRVG